MRQVAFDILVIHNVVDELAILVDQVPVDEEVAEVGRRGEAAVDTETEEIKFVA